MGAWALPLAILSIINAMRVAAQFLEEVVRPVLHPAALAVVRRHQDAGDLVAIVHDMPRWGQGGEIVAVPT